MAAQQRLLMALDIAKRTGFCIGLTPLGAGSVWAGAITLGGPADDALFCAGRIGAWLRDRFERQGIPAELAIEEKLPPPGQAGSRNTIISNALQGAVCAVAACYGVPVVTCNNQTWRKAVTGKGRWGDRDLGKRKVFEAVVDAGLIEEQELDSDMGDATGIWMYRSACLRSGATPGEKWK